MVMADKAQKTPKSPRLSLPQAIAKALEVFDKEDLHAVAPDVVAVDLGYTSSRTGAAATVLATLKMFGLLEKASGRKYRVTEDLKRFKYTPNGSEKHSIAQDWFRQPRLFASIIEKHQGKRPSDAAFRYELIQEYGFNETAANRFIKLFRESSEFVESLASDAEHATDAPDDDEAHTGAIIDAPDAATEATSSSVAADPDQYSIHIKGPGIDSTVLALEEADLLIVEAMLNKVRKKLKEAESNKALGER
jgi:hypothetical protein